MKTINLNNESWDKLDDLTLTIGNFDGVHKGHQRLIKTVKSFSDYKTAVMTLEPHPSIFFEARNFYTLFTIEEKEAAIANLGVDYFLVVDFGKDFSSLSINEFIGKLKSIGVKRLVLGHDFRFAFKGSGTVDDLKNDFEVILVDDIKSNDEVRISTTYIKELLVKGEIRKANSLLGHNYFIIGDVEHGNKVGKTLGFPTANINYKDSFLPGNGVYIVTIEINNIKHYGICNVGNNPTINYSRQKKMEVYILDYRNQIYNEVVRVDFIDKIRDELKFSSKEELIEQMNLDEDITRNLIKNNKV